MGLTSHVVLRGTLAGAVAVLAFHLSGTIAVAQQVAVSAEDTVNSEGQAAGEPSTDEERPDETRQIVPLHTSEAPGTIIIDTGQRYLYLVQLNDLAIRYGIGVGRIGFQWSGVERVSQKQEWPDWRAPPEMVGRQPYLPRFMAGGPGNPRRASPLSRSYRLPYSRNEPGGDDRARRFFGMLSSRQRRRDRSLRPRPGRRKSPRQAVGSRFLMWDCAVAVVTQNAATKPVPAANTGPGAEFIKRRVTLSLRLASGRPWLSLGRESSRALRRRRRRF